MTPEEFRRIGHQLVDWIADYRSRVAEYPVMSTVKPGDIRRKLPGTPPETPERFEAIIQDLDAILLPGISHWNHPGWYGYFPANASLSSVLGDLLSTGLGVLGLNWQSSPALTEVEELVTDWMRQMVGLSGNWQGVIQDTASTSSLVALLCARERVSSHSQAAGGLQAEPVPLIVYTSAQSHSSVEKAALLAGFGRDNVRSIATGHNHALRVDLLKEAIESDQAKGNRPCAVAATIGTTTTTALDPLEPIAELSRAQGMWLHVDAAMAGSAMILPECRWMWQGIEEADSLVLNAHKWLGSAFDTSLYYIRDPEHLIRTMSTNPSYLRTAADAETRSYRDWGIPLGRRFRSLKLWCLIREQGLSGLQARLRRDLENAQWLKTQVEQTPNWECLAPVPLQTVCVRHTPPGLSGEALDRHTLAWVDRINRGGQAYLTPAQLDGSWMVRVSIGSERTTFSDVQQLWSVMQKEAEPENP
ncbi:MAG: aspartate aminotransferase family protein [Desulfohalobiaceae bacterium]|nr:aspartate aminotransferase family protein [Desulfohalobiaceae bacterium]